MGKRKWQGSHPEGRKKANVWAAECDKPAAADDHARFSVLSYYSKLQNVVPPSEFDAFVQTMKQPLPLTFRMSNINGMQRSVTERLLNLSIVQQQSVEVFSVDESKPNPYRQPGVTSDQKFEMPLKSRHIPPPHSLSWYPEAWQFDASKPELRKTVGLAEFRQFLIDENDCGNINRQEAVSMIPPLLLQCKPHHLILDMCAAPGSKTAQLLEFLHASKSASPLIPMPTQELTFFLFFCCCWEIVSAGLVVANDADAKRCHLLVHQLLRFESPNFLVTNHAGQMFPTLKVMSPTGPQTLPFDRILCDVPCTGDGTLRKNPQLWKNWRPQMAHALHPLQLIISMRAIQLLRSTPSPVDPNDSGLMVYSTCSLNPIEDEAVLAELLRRHKDEIELVNVDEMLPGLQRCPGVSDWLMTDSRGEVLTHEEWRRTADLVESGATLEGPIKNDIQQRKLIRQSMFPPTPEEAKWMNLHYSMRILPHHQNTGGFFIALLRRKMAPITDDLSSTSASSSTEGSAATIEIDEAAIKKALADAGDVDDEDSAKGSGSSGGRKDIATAAEEDPFQSIPEHLQKSLFSWFNFSSEQLTTGSMHLATRSAVSRRIYLLGPMLAQILAHNTKCKIRGFDVPFQTPLKFVQGGLRMFEYNTTSLTRHQRTLEEEIVAHADESRIAILRERSVESHPCHFRITQEASRFALNFLHGSPRIVPNVPLAVVRRLLEESFNIRLSEIEEMDAAIAQQIRSADTGSVLLLLEDKYARRLSDSFVYLVDVSFWPHFLFAVPLSFAAG